MATNKKYSIRNLKADFPDDSLCLEFIFQTLHSKKCSCGGSYAPLFWVDDKGNLEGRRQYQCSKCRYQIAPTAGTIFHKSDTPLTLWFHALFVFSNAKSGISAKEVQRHLGVTYKTAWRILHRIRKALPTGGDFLSGDVEMDEAYFGGKGDGGKDNHNAKEVMRSKSVVIGAVARKGDVRAEVTKNAQAKTIGKFLDKHINPVSSRLFTDDSNRYATVARGYSRYTVDHGRKEWVRGTVHINTIESFWAHVKRSIKGTHKSVSKQHLQSYLDAFAWHRNHRDNDYERFVSLLGALLPVGE